MKNSQPHSLVTQPQHHAAQPNHFAGGKARKYDEHAARFAPLRASLLRCMDAVLADAPEHARTLCVGAGTGDEALSLARAFPSWHFTLVEPSADMLALCREKAEQAEIADRCSFHEGYVDTLPPSDPFDVATSIQVSHFITDPEKRTDFYRQIASRMKPGAYLVNVECAGVKPSPGYQVVEDAWVAFNEQAGYPTDPSYLGRDVAMVPVSEIETMLRTAGFTNPVLFHQALLLYAWVSRKA